MIFLWDWNGLVVKWINGWDKAVARTALHMFPSVCPSLARAIKAESFAIKQLFLDFGMIQAVIIRKTGLRQSLSAKVAILLVNEVTIL